MGTLEPRKNLRALVEAWRLVSSRLPDHKLIVVGGAGKKSIAQEALPPSANVVFAGRLSDSELAKAYQTADLAVFPSRYEGFGLPILEAMASGCPILCNDIPVFREVGGDAPRYVPADPANLARATLELIQDENTRTHMRKKGIAQSTKFSWERSAAATRAILNEFTP